MSEEWRRKAYYRTRVLIPIDECLDSAFGDCLVCLTGGELNLIRNLLLYAERRSTFVDEYHETYYLAPTNDDWDALQEMKAHLEGNLMDCEQFTSDLQEILDWVRLQSTLPGGTFSEDELAAFPYNDVLADNELTPAEEDACEIAQLWFEWGYQVITETVLPATRWGFDYLIPMLAAFIATAIGGPVAGAGVWAIAEFIQELMEIGYRGAETNLVNWMDTNKEDIVCVLFGWLKVGGDASVIWQEVEDAIIDPAEDISYGDKLMLSLFMGSWAGSNAQLAFDEATEWATSNVEAGYCDECAEVHDFEQYWTFPSCPQGWTPNGVYAVCYQDMPGCRQYAEVNNGEWYGPTFVDFAPGYYACEMYIEFSSNNPASSAVGYINLEKRELPAGGWSGVTGSQEVLHSIGGQDWTSDEHDFEFTAVEGWEYRLQIRADYINNSNPTQILTRQFDFVADVTTPP